MKLYEKDNSIILEEIENFDARAIFTCGQAFRWYEESDGSFTTVHLGRVLNVLNEKNRVIFKGTNLKEFDEIWMDYFDLNTDYKEIRKVLSNNEILPKAMEYGQGIRILNQNHFEMLISFIISANNMIPRIKKSIEVISVAFLKAPAPILVPASGILIAPLAVAPFFKVTTPLPSTSKISSLAFTVTVMATVLFWLSLRVIVAVPAATPLIIT